MSVKIDLSITVDGNDVVVSKGAPGIVRNGPIYGTLSTEALKDLTKRAINDKPLRLEAEAKDGFEKALEKSRLSSTLTNTDIAFAMGWVEYFRDKDGNIDDAVLEPALIKKSTEGSPAA